MMPDLQLLEVKEQKTTQLRTDLISDKESTIIDDFDLKKHLADLNQKHR